MSQNKGDLRSLESQIKATMHEWNVPGLSIAVTKGSDIVLQRGFGKRNHSSDAQVDVKTIFPIASCTKAFTTTAIATLVDHGILDWDVPIKNYIPEFEMYDPSTSEQLTLRDIACHRSGLPRHDMAWYASAKNMAERVHRIKHLQTSQPFRSALQYNNLMYMVAGYAMERVTGTSWEEIIHRKILQPLQMYDTNFNLPSVSNPANYAHPHVLINAEIQPTKYLDMSAIGPAGSISSNVEDMTKWLLFHASGREPRIPEIISEQSLSATYTPHMAFSIPPIKNKEVPIQTYALGWSVSVYRGNALIAHDGGVDGFSAYVGFIPSEALGIVILANLEDVQSVLIGLARSIFDQLLGLEKIDWSAKLRNRQAQGIYKNESARIIQQTDLLEQQLSNALSDYVRKYRHAGYGELEVRVEHNQLYISYYSFCYVARNASGDVFTLEKVTGPSCVSTGVCNAASFMRGSDGAIEGVYIRMEADPNVGEIFFRKVEN